MLDFKISIQQVAEYEKNPDLRIGQQIVNAYYGSEYDHKSFSESVREEISRLFYVSNEDFYKVYGKHIDWKYK